MKNSKITLIRTHGSKISIAAGDGSLSIFDLQSLPSNYFDFSELIIYGACLTAEGGASDSGNLVNTTAAKGARTVIGFSCQVNAAGCNYWCEKFFEYYAVSYGNEGVSIENLCISTIAYLQNKYPFINIEDNIIPNEFVVAGSNTMPTD